MKDDHLPADGQQCETCGEEGHSACLPWNPGPDVEHLFIQLANVERRAA